MKNGRLIVASSTESADILYASGFTAPDPFIYFSINNKESIILSTLEYNRGVSEAKKGISVLNINDFFLDKEESKSIKSALLGLSRKYSIDTWDVPANFSLLYADFLRSEGIKVNCIESNFFPQRLTKNRDEIDKIIVALRVGELGEAKAFELISNASVGNDGILRIDNEILTSEILRSEIEVVMIRNGGTATNTITACGPQGAEPHNPGNGPIYANKPIIVDIFPQMNRSGYWGDITRTYLKGKAPSLVTKAYEAVKMARDKSKEALKAGVIASKIHQIAYDILVDKGFETGQKNGKHYGFIHSLGHGVGLEIHEGPNVSPMNNSPLETGNIITIEPGVYYPEWGGIRLEDMVAIEDDGCKYLNDFDTFLEIE